MNSNRKWLFDTLVALGLGAALLLVLGVDALLNAFYPASARPESPQLVAVANTKPLRLGVTPVFYDSQSKEPWDDVGALLQSLGEGYKYDTVTREQISEVAKLRDYDVVFFTCGNWQPDPGIISALQEYVAGGGTLYASDWRYEFVAKAFPEMRAYDLVCDGKDNFVNAEVVDPSLADVIGRRVTLHFDLPMWKSAAFGGDRVKVLLRGQFRTMKGELRETPLLVKFSFGRGTVIFTSYHHGKDNSELEKKLLKHLVFGVVTARLQNELESSQHKSQFSPAKSNLFSASKQEPAATYAYQNQRSGKLRFDLGFEDRGAELKLTVTSPKEKVYENKGTKTFGIEVPDAEIGEWKYTITAMRVPYENFAYLINVSHGK